jgi:EAL domain-containing protein (putative c-di-GMP-specific phosphodiesterase class I)
MWRARIDIFVLRDAPMKNNFYTQPILNAETLEPCAMEVLFRKPVATNNETAMMEVDLQALEYASSLVEKTNLRVHSNIEYSTLILAPWRSLRDRIRPGMVIEFVERNQLLSNPDVLAWVLEIASMIRKRGGVIALDDVTPNEIERSVIRKLMPEIIKVDHRFALFEVRHAPYSPIIVAERIETKEQAALARSLGAREIQGFWCDKRVAPYFSIVSVVATRLQLTSSPA